MKHFNKNQEGNVLFLILIAVALFAALSYAVTQSSRSGSGNANKEQASINAAQLTQYPAGVRTAVIRMVIGGTSVSSLQFNPPSGNYAGLTANSLGVFHPDGGGATYVQAPAGMMADGNPGTWHFNAEFAIADIGTTSRDYIAFLPGITEAVCDRVNEDLNISGDTIIGTGDVTALFTTDMHNGYTPGGPSTLIGDSDSPGLKGQPFGCLTDDTTHIYYHLLSET